MLSSSGLGVFSIFSLPLLPQREKKRIFLKQEGNNSLYVEYVKHHVYSVNNPVSPAPKIVATQSRPPCVCPAADQKLGKTRESRETLCVLSRDLI